MSSLSEVSLVIAQRAGDLEKAREIFTAETRAFVTGILGAVRRARSDSWATARVRLDLPREIETEAKSTGYLRSFSELEGLSACRSLDIRVKRDGATSSESGSSRAAKQGSDGTADVHRGIVRSNSSHALRTASTGSGCCWSCRGAHRTRPR
jgi:hypothetical protein